MHFLILIDIPFPQFTEHRVHPDHCVNLPSTVAKQGEKRSNYQHAKQSHMLQNVSLGIILCTSRYISQLIIIHRLLLFVLQKDIYTNVNIDATHALFEKSVGTTELHDSTISGNILLAY